MAKTTLERKLEKMTPSERNKAVAAISMQMGMPTGKTAKAAKPRTSRTAKK